MRPVLEPNNIYAHRHEEQDVILWYNRALWHSIVSFCVLPEDCWSISNIDTDWVPWILWPENHAPMQCCCLWPPSSSKARCDLMSRLVPWSDFSLVSDRLNSHVLHYTLYWPWPYPVSVAERFSEGIFLELIGWALNLIMRLPLLFSYAIYLYLFPC
jgi:hypothetical protein